MAILQMGGGEWVGVWGADAQVSREEGVSWVPHLCDLYNQLHFKLLHCPMLKQYEKNYCRGCKTEPTAPVLSGKKPEFTSVWENVSLPQNSSDILLFFTSSPSQSQQWNLTGYPNVHSVTLDQPRVTSIIYYLCQESALRLQLQVDFMALVVKEVF